MLTETTRDRKVVDGVILKGFGEKMPALFTRASIEPNLLLATSTIFSAVANSAMFSVNQRESV